MLMDAILSPENSLYLQKFIKSTDSKYITFNNYTTAFTILLLNGDGSHYTEIEIEDWFFTSIIYKKEDDNEDIKFQVTFPTTDFYKFSMKSLRILIESSEITIFNFILDSMDYKKTIYNIPSKSNAIDLGYFSAWNSININFSNLKQILRYNYSDCIAFYISENNDYIEMKDKNTTFKIIPNSQSLSGSIDFSTLLTSFQVSLPNLKSSIEISDLFTESYLCMAGENYPINIILRNSTVKISTYLSINVNF